MHERSIEKARKALCKARQSEGGPEGAIPRGPYCWTKKKDGAFYLCPFWALDPNAPHQQNGWCAYLESGDIDAPFSLLWYQIKECRVKDNPEFDA